jgi:eukaryotic translation initiation factor 2C
LKVTPGLIKVPGRVLVSPKVVYKGNKTADPRFGSWNMLSIKFNVGASLAKWSCLVISLPRMNEAFNQQSLQVVLAEFRQVLGRIGVNAAAPFPAQRLQLQHQDDPALGPTLQRAAGSLDLLFIIVPEANMPIYKRIKTLADREYGVHTICSVGSKLAKDRGRDQYMNNVALKFNLKLGGINQLVENKNLGIIDQNKTMVVGVDVTHPSPGSSSNAPSVSAMVASIDKSLGQWPATLRIQPPRQEDVNDLVDMLKSRLNLWKTKGAHAAFPENILIYRDGVSEGQYDIVLSKELPQLRRACEEVYPAPDTKKGLPRITIVICGKRHKTRFYPTTEQDCDKSGNTKPGTVVDRGVTEARNWDFFLQAHAALQGTARPCHYYIVHDEIFRQIYAKGVPPQFQNIADIVEDLTHNMCYLFGRATKAVSLCPPAYYADLACERARCYLANLFDTPSPSAAPSVAGASSAEGAGQPSGDDVRIHPKLKDTMFYI